MIRLNLTSGEPIALKPVQSGKFRELRIPGSQAYVSDKAGYAITVQFFVHPLYTITLRSFRADKATSVVLTEENSWLRIEVPLAETLSLHTKKNGHELLQPGQYHFIDQTVIGLDLPAEKPLIYVTIHYSKEIISGLGTDEPIEPTSVLQAPLDLLGILQEILKCPFKGRQEDFYLANKVRDVLFAHSTREPVLLPGELSEEQIALMHEADNIMANNLDGKITIPELARMLGINFVTLKRNYEKVFGIGIFPRMMQRKMDHIKLLLAKTNKPLKEIADMAGYQTLPGFINAFRKWFKKTPKEWRNEQKGNRNTG